MQSIPRNVSKPFVRFYLFCVVWIDMSSSIINKRRGGLLSKSVLFRAETLIFLLYNKPHQILTSATDRRFRRKLKRLSMFLFRY